MNHKQPKRVYKVIDNPAQDDRAPFALVDPDGITIIQLGASPEQLAAHAFDCLNADEVKHDEDLVAHHYSRNYGGGDDE